MAKVTGSKYTRKSGQAHKTQMIHSTKHRKVFFYAALVLVLLLAAITIFPFFKSVIGALVIAFILYPVYLKILGVVKSKNISAFIVVILALFIVIAPAAFLLNQVVKESTVTYVTLQQGILKARTAECSDDSSVCFLIVQAQDFLQDPKVKFYLTDSLQKFSNSIAQAASEFLVSVPKVVLNIFIFFLALFYFLRDGEYILGKLSEVLPLKANSRDRLYLQFYHVSKSIVYGYVLTALIQGIVALIGFYIMNWFFAPAGQVLVSAPILWAAILALFSMIPFLGSGVIFVPMSLFIMGRGYLDSNTMAIYGGLFLLIYGLVVIAQIDNFIRPLLSGSKAKVHSLLIFLGIFGGLVAFGIMGIIIGPLVLALLVTFLKIYQEGSY